jgi:predicted nucleotidyltransferase
MTKTEIINLLISSEIKDIFNKLWIEHLYLIWSYSRWENTENSDIDLMYTKSKNTRIWGLDFIKNKLLLENKLNKKIDLVNEKYIYSDIKNFINKDKILIY